jgi:hypothetical protein
VYNFLKYSATLIRMGMRGHVHDAKAKIFNNMLYSFVNRTIKVWNQLPAEVLGTLSCKLSNFRKRVRKVIN